MLEKSLTFAEYIKINNLLELSDYYKTDTHWKQENILKIAEKIANQMNANILKALQIEHSQRFNLHSTA